MILGSVHINLIMLFNNNYRYPHEMRKTNVKRVFRLIYCEVNAPKTLYFTGAPGRI